jgi:hypothetical protein
MTNWKEFGRKMSWPSRGTIPSFSWRYWGEPQKNLNQDSRCLDWDSSRTLAEYKFRALPLDQPVRFTTKVHLSLCLIDQAVCHEDIWGSGGIVPPVLTKALDGGQWSASRPDSFSPEEAVAGTQLTADWVGSRADLDAVENTKSCPFDSRRFIMIIIIALYTMLKVPLMS